MKPGATWTRSCATARKRRAADARSKDLARALLEELVSGELARAFSNAGSRVETGVDAYEEHSVAYDKYPKGASNEHLHGELGRLEEEAVRQTDCATCAEFGEDRPEYLKALDFADAWGPCRGVFNVCLVPARRDVRLGKHCSCGLSFPGKLWWQPKKSKRASFCNVDWQMLVDEQSKRPDDVMFKKWVNQMGGQRGSDVLKCPRICCESHFVLRKKRLSMVAEVQLEGGA